MGHTRLYLLEGALVLNLARLVGRDQVLRAEAAATLRIVAPTVDLLIFHQNKGVTRARCDLSCHDALR